MTESERRTTTDELLAAIEAELWELQARPDEWRRAIGATVTVLARFADEVEASCTGPKCPGRVPATTPLPSRLD